jgi:hypothetical protein
VDRSVEENFVFAGKPKAAQPAPPQIPPSEPVTAAPASQSANAHGRAPLTIRFRSDYAVALKRASLERQLKGISPNTLQDILDEAVEPWLRQHGYLT